jgi:DNA-binding NtrC family response regulator
LRERKDDIPLLIDYFIEKFNQEDERQVEGVSDKAMDLLMQYPWPGNVRELENMIHRAVVISRDNVLTHKDFPQHLALGPAGTSSDMLSEPITISEGEKILILKSLDRNAGNRTKAAEELGITTRTLRNKLHEYGMTEN